MSLNSDFFLGLSPLEKDSVFQNFPVTAVYWRLVQKNLDQTLQTPQSLRVSKAKDFLAAVAATWLKAFSTKETCEFWSHQSELRIQKSLDGILLTLQQPQADWSVFAFGKMGSHELNLSSDVDLIWVSGDSAQDHHTKALRIFQNDLQTQTELGFCHRLDFDLRPGGRMGPVVASFEQWSDYFSNFIDAWERLAFIRFRPLWGDPELTQKLEAQAQKLTFKKYLDFGLIEAFKTLRQQIHSQNWMRSQDQKIDLKLGIGGIRDLELFIHTLQVIYGGKEPSVRIRSTEMAILELSKLGALSADDSRFMIQHYWNLRTFENLVQAIGDEQTHILTSEFSKTLISDSDRKKLLEDMKTCDHLVSTLFGQVDRKAKTLPETIDDQILWLKSLGLDFDPSQDSSSAPGPSWQAIWKDIVSQEILSRQKLRDNQAKMDFLFHFLTRSHDLGKNLLQLLPRLKDFIKKSRAKASLFHLLLRNPSQLDRFIHLLGSSGYLSQIIINRPEMLDSFLLERQASIDTCLDWESKIQNWKERRFFSEIYQGLDFLEFQNIEKLQLALTQTADSICQELLQEIKKEIPSTVELLALGKWGGQELGLDSDLDFIFVTQAEPVDTDFQVARRFLNRLTQGDPIYSVDLRLKPFGASGAMMTSVQGLESFLKTEAPAWQRQCYLKARALGGWIEAQKIFSWAVTRDLSESDLLELGKIQKELHRKKESAIKFGPGGLLDIELFTQTVLLKNKQVPGGSSIREHFECIFSKPSHPLQANYNRLRRADQNQKLQSPQLFDESAVVQRITDGDLAPETMKILTENLNTLKQLDPRPRQD